MATPEVKVRIKGDSADLDKGLAGAARSLGDFAGKIPLVGAAVAAAGAAIGAFAKGAVEEAAAAEQGMVRLGVAVGNAGGDFTALRPEIEKTVTKFTQLTTATDDDLRAALTNLITISGDTKGSLSNLGLVTDLAAFKNIELSQAADIVGKAMNGTTTAFNKMGVQGKDATTVLENARASFGGFAEQQAKTLSGSLQRIVNQWGEFKEAVGTAVLSGGDASAMADGLAGVLAGLVSWVENNEEAFLVVAGVVRDAGGALFEVGRTVYEVVQPALGPVMKVLIGTLLGLLQSATFGVRFLAATFKALAGDSLQALGTLTEKGGKLLRVFGVDVVAESGKSLREFGTQLSASAKTSVDDAKEQWSTGMRAILEGRRRSNESAEGEEVRHVRTVSETHRRGQEERLTKAQLAAQIHEELMRQANKIFEDTVNKIQRPALKEMAVDWEGVDRAALKVTGKIMLSKDAQEQLASATEGVRKKQEDVLNEADKTKRKFDDNVDSVRALGGGLIDAAQGMGLLDQKAGSALNSVLNMGTAIAKFGLGSPEGILAIVGGLANLIGGWGSSAAEQARKQALRENTQAIEDLSRDLSEYNLGVSGRTFSGVTGALEGIFKDSPQGRFVGSAELGAVLRASGLSITDAKKLADKYGIDVENDQLGWFKLLQVLKARKFGSGEGNFADELASLTDSFDVLGVEDEDDRLKAFEAFVDKNIPALKGVLGDLSTEQGRAAAVDRLRALYRDSIAAKIPANEYGNASPGQFRSVVSSLLQLLGKADGLPSANAPTSGLAGTGAAASVGPSAAVGAAGGMPYVNPFGANGVTGSGFAAPTLALGGESIGTQINGDFAPVFNIYQQPGEDMDEFVDRITPRVLALAGQQYINQVTALGVRP